MINDIYDPLDEYVNVFKDKFKTVCESTFAQLAAEADVNVELNRKTCAEIDDAAGLIARLKSQITRWTVLCVILWIVAVGAALFGVACFTDNKPGAGCGFIAGALLVVWALLGKIHPKLKALKAERDNTEALHQSLLEAAWQQMEPLNRLYDWEIFTRMMTQTVPRLEFDPFFTTQRLEDLKVIYGWDEAFNAERSVLFSHSGLINGNPFVICRTKKMEWGQKQYSGQLTIHWTETVRGSDGKYHTQRRSQTLTATISRPCPEYHKKTRLIYGNTAAPDLTFLRTQSNYAEKSGAGKWLKKKALQRKARNMSQDYAMMTNEEFEAAFDTSNRNNNQQFALLFTPLAQNSMMSILEDREAGFGDDFDFEKARMINIIIAKHMQAEEMDMNPAQFRNYNFDRAAEEFCRINSAHFRAIYFAFAPLLAVPMYQQIRSHENIYGRDMKRESAYWEHEALANFWGTDRFKHPDCVTDCILKTEKTESTEGSETTIRVQAYGFRTEPRLTYVEKFGGDGRYHKVPVHWEEYLPVTGQGSFDIKEDHPTTDTAPETQTQRITRIQSLLAQSGHSLYRRNISSRL
ncbi:MAG: hypothetical protein HDR86_03720 [Bacteroides sp.]|nr:hypothetical protein [Bacteroides sp.]